MKTKSSFNPFTVPVKVVVVQRAAEGKPLRGFHGSRVVGNFYRARVAWHAERDQFRRGHYTEGELSPEGGFTGCAVGCSIHGSNHQGYESQIGVPMVLARLEDRIFESLAVLDLPAAKAWPVDFMGAIREGADLGMVWPRFALWLLADPEDGVLRLAKRPAATAAIKGVTGLYEEWVTSGKKPDVERWRAARSAAAAYAAAYAAADAAADAAAYAAADAAADAAAAYAAAYAADAAYAAAAYDAAAYAAAAYAAAAYAAAAAAAAYAAAAAAARLSVRRKQAAKLLELMRSAPVDGGAA